MKSPSCNPKTASNMVKTQKETKKNAKNAKSSSTVDRKGTKNIVIKKEVDEQENVAAAMVVVEEAAEVAEMEEWKAAWAGFWSDEVDEQTAWASCWCPFWEMEGGDEDAYNALYDDVLWDYDIWDLKSIDNANSWKG
ncbi:hypothetical protein CASFOL_004093 [Castilleja foliolosa]|uniref:Uncharacterized protein n=1 Tax=Castilleja foliolosa TaxID=1961234 RepID=A0ABD3EL03_9LAMI